MSGLSPDSVLVDSNSNSLAVQNGVAIPTSTPALMMAGSDGTNSRYILIDGSSRVIIAGAGVAGTPAGGVLSVQGVASGTALPVSQNGTWTIQPGNTANTIPWLTTINQGGNSATVSATGALKTDSSDVTQPVSISTNNIVSVRLGGPGTDIDIQEQILIELIKIRKHLEIMTNENIEF